MVKLINKLPTLDTRNDTLEWVVLSLGAAMLIVAVIGTALPTDVALMDDTSTQSETQVF